MIVLFRGDEALTEIEELITFSLAEVQLAGDASFLYGEASFLRGEASLLYGEASFLYGDASFLFEEATSFVSSG